MSIVVAVYGSLRKGLHNHSLLKDSVYLGDGVLDRFKMYSQGSFPLVTPDERSKDVVVEVYSVNEATGVKLDNLEGFPHHYNRTLTTILCGGDTIKAWVYYIKDGINKYPVDCGDWVEYLKQEEICNKHESD